MTKPSVFQMRKLPWYCQCQIGLMGLVEAYKRGCRSHYETAEYLGVTEEYLEECVHCYRKKYGVCTTVDNYIIYFIPALTVGRMVKQDENQSFLPD